MSSTFRPDTPPREFTQPQQTWLRRVQNAIKTAWEAPKPHETLQVRYSAPERLEAGMVVYADGVTWDPGSGEGIYRRNKGNTAWVFVG